MLAWVILAAAPPPGELGAQEARRTLPDRVREGATVEREVFIYRAAGRRDPFQPLLPDQGADQLRFEDLRLIGILVSDDPSGNIALLAARSNAGSLGAGARTFRVRPHSVLGGVRILRVERLRIVVEIDRLGMREEQEVLLERRHGRTVR